MSDTEVAGLREAVQTLDLTTRRVLTLHYAEGLTPTEVAMVLDITDRRVEEILAALRAFASARLGVGSAGQDCHAPDSRDADAGALAGMS